MLGRRDNAKGRKGRTDEGDNVNLLPELVLVASSDPIAISAAVWSTSDPREHVT